MNAIYYVAYYACITRAIGTFDRFGRNTDDPVKMPFITSSPHQPKSNHHGDTSGDKHQCGCRQQAPSLRNVAPARLLRHPQPMGRGQRALSAQPRLQGARHHPLGLCRDQRALADNAITRDMALAHLREMVAAVDVPINADFESGFALDAAGILYTILLVANYTYGTAARGIFYKLLMPEAQCVRDFCRHAWRHLIHRRPSRHPHPRPVRCRALRPP